jgi:CDP-paratose synthetase
MRILITGISGNLGSRLAEKLTEKPYVHEIYGIVRPESKVGGLQRFTDKIRLLVCHDSLWNYLSEIEFDLIIHCATAYGRTPEEYVKIEEANINFPIKLLQLLAQKNNRRKCFINADTYYRKYSKESNHLEMYRNSKQRFYELGRSYCLEYDISFFNMIIEHMYGPCEDDSKFVARLFNALNSESEFKLTNGGQLRDFIYIDDVVNAFSTVVSGINAHSLHGIMDFEVGTGKTTRLSDFSIIMRDQLYSNCNLNFGSLAYSDFELMNSYAKTESLFKMGWVPRYNCESGIAAYILERSRSL